MSLYGIQRLSHRLHVPITSRPNRLINTAGTYRGGMSSVFSVSANPGSWTQHDSYPIVTVTAIQTETVHPTWVFTLTGANVTSSTANNTSQHLTVVTTVTTQLSPNTEAEASTTTPSTSSTSSTSTTPDTPSALSPPTTPISSPMEYHPTSTTKSSYTDVLSNTVSTLSLASSHTSQNSPSTVKATISPSPRASSRSPTTTMEVTTSNASLTTSSKIVGVMTSATSPDASTHSSLSPTAKTGIIAGGVIGGSAILIFLCAFLFCVRRNRSAEGVIKQHLLRPSISSTRHSSPITISAPLPQPIRPVFPAHSNPDLSLDSMYLRREQGPRNFEGGFPPSSADLTPSRMASFYSTSSWDGGLGIQEYWDLESGEYMKRDSMRSNPFDLEPPPSVHRPPVPVPAPTAWGVKF